MVYERFIFDLVVAMNLVTTTVWASLSIEDVSEGSCWNSDPPQITFDYSWMMEFIAVANYTPMASKYYYYYLHSLLTGSEPTEMAELDKMCLEIEVGMILHGKGYNGKKFERSCSILSLSKLECLPPGDSQNGTMLYLTAAETKKYVIFAVCTPGKLKAWTLMSPNKVVDKETEVKVLEHVKSLGFDPNKAMAMDYAGCG